MQGHLKLHIKYKCQVPIKCNILTAPIYLWTTLFSANVPGNVAIFTWFFFQVWKAGVVFKQWMYQVRRFLCALYNFVKFWNTRNTNIFTIFHALKFSFSNFFSKISNLLLYCMAKKLNCINKSDQRVKGTKFGALGVSIQYLYLLTLFTWRSSWCHYLQIFRKCSFPNAALSSCSHTTCPYMHLAKVFFY